VTGSQQICWVFSLRIWFGCVWASNMCATQMKDYRPNACVPTPDGRKRSSPGEWMHLFTVLCRTWHAEFLCLVCLARSKTILDVSVFIKIENPPKSCPKSKQVSDRRTDMHWILTLKLQSSAALPVTLPSHLRVCTVCLHNRCRQRSSLLCLMKMPLCCFIRMKS